MSGADLAWSAASALAGLSAAALVCALFYPVLMPGASRSHGRALAQLLDRASRRAAPQTTRHARRAQAIALKLLAEERRMKDMTRLSQKLAHAGLDWSPRRYAIIAAALGVCVLLAGLALRMPVGGCLSAAVLLAVIAPSKGLDFLARRRQRQFLSGFTSAIDTIIRGARSGLSLPDCLAMVASDATPAVTREFVPVVAQLRAGAPLTGAIDRLAIHMPLAEVRFFAIVLTIQSQTGGNFTDALVNLTGVLRERERLAAKVRIASAEVKTSAIVIGAMPFVVVGATALLTPSYIAVLWQEEAGRKLVGIAMLWMAIGIAVLRRMARIEA